MEVYYYIPVNEVSNAVECGLKLSRWSDKTVFVEGEKKKCISALLNPKDDIVKYKSAELKCIKLDLPPRYCFVADKYLYDVGMDFPEAMDMYHSSIIPIQEYIFGSYRLPECLVTTTAITGQISVLDKRLDSPVLFGNSEELYINNIIEMHKEAHDNFSDVMLYYFYCKLAEDDKVSKIEDKGKGIAVFSDKTKMKNITIKIPDISHY